MDEVKYWQSRPLDAAYPVVYSIASMTKVRDAGSVHAKAIETVYPHAIVQLCTVHMVHNSLNYVGWNKRTTK